jgi:hypothetical protein
MAQRLKKMIPSNLGGQFATTLGANVLAFYVLAFISNELGGQFATPKCSTLKLGP